MLMCSGAFMVPGISGLSAHRRRAVRLLGRGWSAASCPWHLSWPKRTKRMKKFEEGLPEALDLIVSALRVGHSLNSALGLVTRECPDPVGSEFRVCFDEQNYGLELKTAMDNLVTRVPLQDLKIVATAILIQKESGGNLAEVLEKTAEVIRERFRLKRQVSTHTAQGRLTGMILTALPVVLGCCLYFVSPKMMSLLWTTKIGIKLLYAAVGHDRSGRIDHSQDRQHGRLKGSYGSCGCIIFRNIPADRERRSADLLSRNHSGADCVSDQSAGQAAEESESQTSGYWQHPWRHGGAPRKGRAEERGGGFGCTTASDRRRFPKRLRGENLL